MVREDLWTCDETGKEVKGEKPDTWISISPNSIFFGKEMTSNIDKFYTFSSISAFMKWLKVVQKKSINLMKEKEKLRKRIEGSKKEIVVDKDNEFISTRVGDMIARE